MSITRHYQQKMALGCDTTIMLTTDLAKTDVDIVFAKLWLKIFEFEKKFSRFLQYSELSIFNNNAGNKVAISHEFEDILIKAKQMAKTTKSIYNPFILPSLHKAGYKDSFIKKYDDEVIDYSHRAVAPIDSLVISSGYAEIPPNTAIDLGGIGKGYLAELLSKSKELKSVNGYWISIGGDIVGNGLDINNEDWQVNMQNAGSPEELLDYVYIPNGSIFAIATSGTITRKGTNSQNKNWHHIIDPRTQGPSKSDILLSTVVTKSACLADVLAKVSVILGSEQAKPFLEKQGVNSYVIQRTNNKFDVSGDFVMKKPKDGTINSKKTVVIK